MTYNLVLSITTTYQTFKNKGEKEMRKTMKKLTQGATRLLVLALGLGLVSTVWAAASLEETGATVPTTATLAFKAATLSQVTADTLSAAFGGGSAGTATGEAPTFNNFDRTSEASGTITCEAQVANDGYIKAVLLTFTQSGSDVNVVKSGAKYITGSAVGPSTASGYTGNYDINKLKLTLGKPTPIAVFDGASGGFKKTSINGVTFDKNGNTVADDGSYVKITAAVGALFKLSAGYNYVVGEFTVTNLVESASADRVLAFWSPNTDGTGATVGSYLVSGGVTTRGIWNNGIWNNTGYNGTLKTSVDVNASRTFALTTEDSKVNGVQNDTGTHLFELTGDNPGTAVYGGTDNVGLRGDQEYKSFAIGGLASGTALSAMTGLVITKVVIYASGSREFVSTATTTIADVENPAAFYVGNGETVNASAIKAGATASGSAYVYTEAGATLNLDAELTGRSMTFQGSISGVPAAGLTLGSANDNVTVADVSYALAFKGSGTVSFPDKKLPAETSWMAESSIWTGTVVLNNCGADVTGTSGHGYVNFELYGNTNSFIRAPGYKGYTKTGLNCTATLVIESGETFTLTDGNGTTKPYFSKLKGSGTLALAKGREANTQYVIGDLSLFTGTVTLASDITHSIVLGGTTSWSHNSSYDKKLVIAGGATIAAGKTWTAPNGAVVNGTLTKTDSTATLSGAITGSGKIIYNDELPNSANFTANAWTGTVEVNGGSTTSAGIEAANATQFMNSGSKFTVASGTVTLGTAAGLTGTVDVNSGATLVVVDTTVTELSLNGTYDGNVNLAACSSLATLNLGCGSLRSLNKITFPSSLTTLNLTIAEDAREDGEVTMTLPTGSAVTTVSASVVDQNGVTKPATATLNGSTVAITFSPTVTGNACWHAYEFNNDWTDSVSVGAHECKTWNGNAPNFAEDSDKAGNYFVYTSIRPGPTDSKTAYSYPTEWSAAIRCTVPQTANGIIVCFGKVTNGAGQNQYIALVSGDTAGKVKLVHGAGGGAAQTIAEMTVANPTTSQHVYVFTKTATTVTVYCDGDLITSKAVSDSPYQAFQFGTMYGGMQSGSGLSAVTDKATGGMVDYTRLYNFAIGQNMIQKLAEDDPYVSSTPTYSREVSGSPWWHTGDGTWLKSDDSTLVGVPDVSGIVDLTATADATMTVNLPAAPVYEKLTFQGAGAVTLVKNGNSPKIATAKLVVKTNVTAPYDIADFSGARVSVDAGKVLTFDFSTYPLESVTGVTTQQVTGVTTRADDRYAVVASAKPAWNSNLSLVYDPVEYVYSVVIDPAALVTKNNTTVAYPTVADALTALSTDAGTVRLLVDYDQDITLSAGQTLDAGSTTYSGTASATGQYAELVHSGTTWKAVDNSVNTWKSSVTAGQWNAASNWENGVIPKTYTRVTFPANDDPEFTGYTVGVRLSGNSDAGWTPVCAGMVVNAKVDMVQGESSSDWGTIHLGGNISGTGTLALHKVGLHNSLGSSTPITVSCGLSVAIKDAADQDCYLHGGPFVFEGAVTATANVLFKAEYCAATFNGTVTMENGTTINGNGDGTTVYNGGISVPADAAATLVGGSRVTIASTVTLAAGATLTVPNAASTSGATFATSVADSYVKATAGESTTVYSVAAKRTATVSVGANAALSINGNAVADGDTVKFVPGDVLTIAASADTYYTPALTVNGAAQTSPYQLTTTDADVTVSVTATLDTYTITIPVVANTTVSVSYTSGGAAQEATAAGDITVDAGTSLTATWTAASGYKITAGASQTINPVVSAQTLDSPTVEVKGVTVSGVTFDYGDDFATARVTATVSGDATTYTLTVGGANYEGAVDGTTVTFSNIVTGHSSAYDSVSYEITATDGTSSVVVSGGSGSAPVADVVNANWINENSTTHGQDAAGGSWTNAGAVVYSDGKAEISDNRFAATTASTASRVVLEFQVCFSSASEETVSGDAQAAIKLGEDDSVTTFKILTTGNEWTSVSNAGLQIDPSETYNVVLTIDYGSKTYKVDVGGNALTNSAGVASFALATSSASVQNIDFAGSGTLTSLKGSQFEGYMVKDALNNFYATIQAATQAYNSANGPYTVLHDGTPPDGWRIDETTKALIKLAKGFFFMAY